MKKQGITSSGYLVIDKLLMLSVCLAKCGHFCLQKLRWQQEKYFRLTVAQSRYSIFS